MIYHFLCVVNCGEDHGCQPTYMNARAQPRLARRSTVIVQSFIGSRVQSQGLASSLVCLSVPVDRPHLSLAEVHTSLPLWCGHGGLVGWIELAQKYGAKHKTQHVPPTKQHAWSVMIL
jgi:hypothetical protein